MKKNIATIPGDGIGPDVVREGVAVLNAIAKRFGHEFAFTETLMGVAALDAKGVPLPPETLEICKKSDAVLLGAVGGPVGGSKIDQLPGHLRPEAGLLALRGGMGVYANLRPAIMFPCLADACPLKAEIVSGGLDIMIIRELTGGMYFGDRGRTPDGKAAWDTEKYSIPEIERLLKVGFETALKRAKKLCVVDKANVLESSRLWREVSNRMASSYPGVEVTYMYVDNCAMQLVKNPKQFDVIATSNMFGDIISDEASMITGSIGMLASASLGDSGPGLYEPIHGSAPDIAGMDKANPLATILSTALLLRYSFKMEAEALAVESAVSSVLENGFRCADIALGSVACTVLGTRAMGQKVIDAINGGK